MLQMGKLRHRGRMTQVGEKTGAQASWTPRPASAHTSTCPIFSPLCWVPAGDRRTLPCQASQGADEPLAGTGALG